jgi:hypothetical protein
MAERSKALVSGFLSKLLVRNGVGSNPTLVRVVGSIPISAYIFPLFSSFSF